MNSDLDLWRQLAVSACLLRSILQSQTFIWEQHAQLELQWDKLRWNVSHKCYLFTCVRCRRGKEVIGVIKPTTCFMYKGKNTQIKSVTTTEQIMLTSVNYIIKWTKSGLQTAPKVNMIRKRFYVDFIAIKKQFSMHATAHNRSMCVDVQCNWKLICGHKKNTKQTKPA